MNTGTITLGGPMVSAGDLVFTAAAMDNYLRALDSETGKELWKYQLPAGGQGHSHDLRAQTVSGYRCGWPRQTGHEARRLRNRFHAALKKSNKRKVFITLA